METKDKILELIAEQGKIVTELCDQLQVHAGRIGAFQASIDASSGDQTPAGLIFKRKIEAKITEEKDAIDKIGLKITNAKARKSAFEETLKILPKNGTDAVQKDLRANTELARVRSVLLKEAKPLTLDEIISKIGKALEDKRDDKSRKISLRGSLRGYAKDGKFFTIEEAADTFGLIEFKKTP
jgi:hypothetical protein